MFKFVGGITIIVGIFWLGDTIGFDGVQNLVSNLKEVHP